MELDKEEVLDTMQPSGITLREELDNILSQITIKADEINAVLDAIEDKTKATVAKTKQKGTTTKKAPSNFVPRSVEQKKKAKEQIDNAKARLSEWLKKQGIVKFAYNPQDDIQAHKELLSITKDLILGYINYGIANITTIKEKLTKALGAEINIDTLWSEVYDEEISNAVKGAEKEILENAILNALKNGDSTKEQTIVTQLARLIGAEARKIFPKTKNESNINEKVKLLFKNKELAKVAWKNVLDKAIAQTKESKLSDEQKAERIKKLEDAIADFITVPNSISRRAIQKGLKDLNTTIQEIAKMHYTEASKETTSLIDKLVLEAGLSYDDAKEYAEILQKEIDKQLKEKKTKILDSLLNPKERKSVKKSELEKIVDAINLGALSSDEFSNLFAKKFGFKALTNEQAEFIQNTINLMFQQNGLMRRRITQKLADYIDTLKPFDARNVGRLIQQIFYQSTLSGLQTVGVNIPVGSGLSVLTNLIPVFFKNPGAFINANIEINNAGLGGTGTKAFFDTLLTGYNDIHNHMTDDNFMEKGSRYHKFLQDVNTRSIFNTLANIYRIPMHLGYVASAFDNIINHRGGEILNYISEYNEIDKAKHSAEQIHEMVIAKMGYDKASVYREQVDDEIEDLKANNIKIPIGFKEQRIKELMIQQRNKDMQQEAYNLIRAYGLMGKPEGISGALYNVLAPAGIINDKDSNLTAIAKSFYSVGIASFLRISFALAGAVTKSIPILGLPSVAYTIKKNKETKRNEFVLRPKSQIIQGSAIQAISLAAIIIGFMEMFDIEKDKDGNISISLDPNRPFDISGTNVDFFDQDKLRPQNKQYLPLSIRTRNSDGSFGKFVPIAKYTPILVPAMAILGNLRNDLLIKKDSEETVPTKYKNYGELFGTLLYQSLYSSYSALADASYNSLGQFIEKVSDIYSYENKNPIVQKERKQEEIKKLAFNTAVRPIKSIVEPNIARDAVKTIEVAYGSQKTMDSPYKNALRDFYFVDQYINHKALDMFGNKMMHTSYFLNDKRYDLPEWKLLEERNILFDPPYFYKTATFGDTKVNLSSEDKLILNDKVSIEFGNLVRSNIEYLKELSQIELIDELNYFADEAKATIENMDYKEAITPTKP